MDSQTVRDRLVGPRWEYLLLSLVAGFFYAVALDLIAAVMGFGLPVEFLVLVIALSIALTHFEAGIISNWMAGFGSTVHILGKGTCGGLWDGSNGVAVCMPPSLMELLPQALTAAVIIGTVGFGITKLTHWRHKEPPVWLPILYFVVPMTFAFLLLEIIDKCTSLLCVVNLC